MKYYRVRCLYCNDHFVGLEPKDDFVCDDCMAEKRDKTTHFQCPDCKHISPIHIPHDGHYRCTKCINKRKALQAKKRGDMELRVRAERYRIKMFGKDGGKL